MKRLRIKERRAPGFWPLALVFGLFVLFLYGPVITIFVLSFQGPEGGLTFPMRGLSTHWYAELWKGLGVVDIKATEVESADAVARAIERAEATLGAGRVRYIHPYCGFWMLKRSIADRKMEALVKGRDKYLGR